MSYIQSFLSYVTDWQTTCLVVVGIAFVSYVFVIIATLEIRKLQHQINEITDCNLLLNAELKTVELKLCHVATYNCNKCGKFVSKNNVFWVDDTPACPECKLEYIIMQSKRGEKCLNQ